MMFEFWVLYKFYWSSGSRHRIHTACVCVQKQIIASKNRTHLSEFVRVWVAKMNCTDFQWSRIIGLLCCGYRACTRRMSYIELLPIGVYRPLVSSSVVPHHTVDDGTALNSNLAFAAVNLMCCPIEWTWTMRCLFYYILEYIMEFIAHIHECANRCSMQCRSICEFITWNCVYALGPLGLLGYRKRLFGHFFFLFCSSPFCSGSRWSPIPIVRCHDGPTPHCNGTVQKKWREKNY